MSNRIVKRAQHTESYQADKLHTSIRAACLSVREFTGSAELTAEHVVKHVETWLAEKYEVTSEDLRRKAAEALHQYNPAAAYVYLTHYQLN